jgi:hypothetical protein
MMSKYTPDNFVVLEIVRENDTLYRVLGGWNGGYLDGSSWRLNSGITSVKEDEDYFYFYGSSGSCYQCHKDSYRSTMATSGIYNELREDLGDAVKMMPEDTDWSTLNG